jgi:hypothetical protein
VTAWPWKHRKLRRKIWKPFRVISHRSRFSAASCLKNYVNAKQNDQDRQCAYKGKIEGHSRNHFAVESHKYYTFWMCVSVALVIQHALRTRRIVICGLSGCVVFFHIVLNGTIFGKKGYWIKNCVFIFSANLPEILLIIRGLQPDIVVNLRRYSCQILTKLGFSRQIFEKFSNIKFHEKPSSESRVVPCGRKNIQTEGRTEKQTHMIKLIVAFCNCANAPKAYTRTRS